jgi:hypothetical protein
VPIFAATLPPNPSHNGKLNFTGARPGGGNMTTTRSIADYAKQINTCWRKTTDSVLETAALCAEAAKSLSDDDKTALVKKLDFSPAAFSKLVKIGDRKELQTNPIKTLLPPNYSIVYELAKLDDNDLKRAVSDGIVRPGMSRASLKQWIGGGTSTADEQDVVFGTLRIPVDYDAGRKMQLEAELEKLKAKFDFEFERPRDPMLEERERLEKRFDRLLRSRARAHIRDLKSQKLGAGRKKVAEDQTGKLWPFSDADVTIADDATPEQVRAILSKVGSADQYKRIFDEVRRICGLSEEQVEEHPTLDPNEAVEELLHVSQQGQAPTAKSTNNGRGTARH